MTLTLSDELRSWMGRTRVVEDEVSLGAVRRIASMLDLDPNSFRRGDMVPPHWFALFCVETPRRSDLARDGLMKPGVVLPPIPQPRRMGAGRRATILGRLRVGDIAVRTTEIAAIVPKQARTGLITILTLRHTIRVNDELVAVDEFDTIYREAVTPGQKSVVTSPAFAPTEPDWRIETHLSSLLVFRFSAITWNSHRIHYDADYARAEEGFPTTVQNGELTIQLLLDAAVANTRGRLKRFSAKLTRPIYVGDTVTLAGHAPKDGKVITWAQDLNGHLCAKMECEFA